MESLPLFYSFHQLGQRPNQEDSRYPDEDCAAASGGLYMVCDGVGGEEAGERASTLVCREYAKRLKDCQRTVLSEADIRKVSAEVEEAFMQEARGRFANMATTLAMLCFHKNGVFAVHAGDSRIYHIRGEQILFRSADHSLVAAMQQKGLITEEQAEHHPQRNIITSCFSWQLINDNNITIDIRKIKNVKPGDYFFICSDGVTSKINDRQLIRIIADNSASDKEKTSHIARLCQDSSDNNTAILLRAPEIKQGFLQRIKNIFTA